MYRYDEFDDLYVRNRVSQFRSQVDRRISGALTEDEFKPLRLQNGVYLQLHAYMLRVAIPYGTLSARQMDQLATFRQFWRLWPMLGCMQSRPPAIASGMSPLTILPAPPLMRSKIPDPLRNCSGNGQAAIRNSPFCRESSRSRLPVRQMIVP